MQEIKKIILSPTHQIKALAPEAIGSIIFFAETDRVSVNLFNLPEPEHFLRGEEPSTSYMGWLYNPTNGQTLAIGTLTSAGEQLYWLYDTPIEMQDGFTEVIITAERANAAEPNGEILLIGYITSDTPRPLEQFAPFAPELPNHRWWKVRRTSTEPVPLPCGFCKSGEDNCTRLAEQGFDLPEIIGIKNDENGNAHYIIHGIPGRFLRSEQPDAGRTGYLHWQPYYGMEKKVGAIGYWLSYIDLHTDQTAIPEGVTIPPG